MTQRTEARVTDMFDQAVQTFGDAMKTGVRIQEDVSRWWSDMLDQTGPVQEWQKRSRALVSETIPAAQQNAEQWLKMVESNYRRSMQFLQRAFTPDEAQNPQDLQHRTQDLWEGSLTVMRDNVQAMAEANLKMMELWAEVMRKNLENGRQVAAKTTEQAAKAAAGATDRAVKTAASTTRSASRSASRAAKSAS